MCARVEPRDAAPHDFRMQLTGAKIHTVEVSNLELATRRRLKSRSNLRDPTIIKIKPSYRVLRFGLLWFLAKADRFAGSIELDDPVAFGILNPVSENSSAFDSCGCVVQQLRQPMAVKNIVPQGQAHIGVLDEFPADDECLRDALGSWLNRVVDFNPPVGTASQKSLETILLVRRVYNQYLAYPGHHKHGQRIVDH